MRTLVCWKTVQRCGAGGDRIFGEGAFHEIDRVAVEWGCCCRIRVHNDPALSLTAAATEVKRIEMAAGKASTTVSGRIKGDGSDDYLVTVKAGQKVKIKLRTNNSSSYFNVLPQGSQEAVFNGSIAGDTFEMKAGADAAYQIQVYLMRNAARRNETASYKLDVAVGDGSQAAPAAAKPDFADGLAGGPDFWAVSGVPAGDGLTLRQTPGTKGKSVRKLANGTTLRNLGCKMQNRQRWCEVEQPDVAGTRGWVNGKFLKEGAAPAAAVAMPAKYNASGQVKCSASTPALDGMCDFRVIRHTGGAEIWILKPGETAVSRFLGFDKGQFKTDDGQSVMADRKDDNWSVSIGGVEYYFIPDALIFGG